MSSSFLDSLSEAQRFVYYRTYSRWVEELGRRESWEETVDRYFSFFEKKFKDKVPKTIFESSRNQVLGMKVMPSMRALWAAGPALENNNIIGYNCCSLVFKDLQAPVELFYILMCGCGVGFSVENQFISQMPEVARFKDWSAGIHVVGDSREGWATSLKIGLEHWFKGEDLEFDYSQVRPKGARLKTMGGRASGPEPLKRLHTFVRDVVLQAQGRQLNSIEWLDIGNMIGEVVVVGGVRRASEITFSDLNDEPMRHAKDFPFPPHRYMSNNSAVYNGKPDLITFMKEWTALAASGSGERGIFNLQAAKEASPRRVKADDLRTNPCFSKETLIQTRNGHFPIESLVGKNVEIWDGNKWVETNNFRVTAENQKVFKITLRDGSVFRVTPYHKIILENRIRIDAKDLAVGDRLLISDAPVSHGNKKINGAYLKGMLVADGTFGKHAALSLYEPKYVCRGRLIESALEVPTEKINTNALTQPDFKDSVKEKRTEMRGLSVRPDLDNWGSVYKDRLPDDIFNWDYRSKLEFIAGYMDGDGTASDTKNGFMYQVSSINKVLLLQFQNLLKTIGVHSRLSLMKKSGKVNFNDGYGDYKTKDSWRLTISQKFAIELSKQVKFSRLSSFSNKKLVYKSNSKFNKIVSIEDDGIEDKVYCCTIDSTHSLALTNGLMIGQCGEINLRADMGEFCNLCEVIVRSTDTFDDLVEKVKAAVWMGAMQACLTDFPFIRPSFKEICEEERLLGISLTGQMDYAKLMTPERLEDLRLFAIKTCKKACKALGINMSAAITTGKPSGTVSQLVNCASGAHPRYDKYYIRRYRISSTDPLFKMMRAQGINFTPENGQGPKDVEKSRKESIKKGRTPEEAAILIPEWTEDQVMTWVVSFPEASPKNALTRHDIDAIGQLEWYLKLKKNWCEHNQSITIYVKETEWLKVGAWVYDHFNDISGISFLPWDGGLYEQAPYETITKEEYDKMVKMMPTIDYSKLSDFEKEDNTTGAKALACGPSGCELV